MLRRNFKSIALGAVFFVAGQLLAAALTARAGNSSGSGALNIGLWLLAQFSSYIAAALAGAVAARIAVDRPIVIGVVAVLAGTALLLVPAVASGQQGLASAVIAPFAFALFASLGAVVGAHLRVKGGT